MMYKLFHRGVIKSLSARISRRHEGPNDALEPTVAPLVRSIVAAVRTCASLFRSVVVAQLELVSPNRTMRAALTLATIALVASVSASDTLDLADGKSPDGSFSVRVRAPMESGEMAQLEVLSVAAKTVVGTTDTGGYAHYPAVAEAASTSVLWSPDSKHLAVMTRGTKRSTELRLYRVTASGLAEILLPSSKDRAFQLLKAREAYRCVFQRPKKWIDNDTLIVLASGDIANSMGDKIPIWYEVEVTFNVPAKKITDAKIITKKPKEG